MSLRIAVLTVGDELLTGELVDTNTAVVGRLLGDHGYRLRESWTVGDCEEDIRNALLELARRNAVVIVAGGLGPTADDLTARAAAGAVGQRLALDPVALDMIRDHFRRHAGTMEPRNEKQALLPQRATPLPNSRGTAPGFRLRYQGSDFFFLPGVPAEMEVMLKQQVLPKLIEGDGGEPPLCQRVLKVFGLSEPETEARLEGAGLPAAVRLAFGVAFPEVHVKLRAAGTDGDRLLDKAELLARRALGDHVVAVAGETLAGNVVRLLAGAGLTLALAESCTGGLIAHLLTDIPGASEILERGAVTYANKAKADWLGVSEEILEGPGAVSAECARAMARGIRLAAGADLGLAVTGIAGPGGGTEQKPVGTVFLALAGTDRERVEGYRFEGDRRAVRRLSACTALDWLRRYAMESADD